MDWTKIDDVLINFRITKNHSLKVMNSTFNILKKHLEQLEDDDKIPRGLYTVKLIDAKKNICYITTDFEIVKVNPNTLSEVHDEHDD